MISFRKISALNAPSIVVFANGDFPQDTVIKEILNVTVREKDRLLIVCDGAVDKLLTHTGLIPDIVIGDLDSLSSAEKEILSCKLIQISEQETNDLTKAVTYVQNYYNPESILILGASGGREDHLIANVSLLNRYAHKTPLIIMMTDEGVFLSFQNNVVEFSCEPRLQISLFDFLGNARITTHGLRWELNDAIFEELWCGTLNEAVGNMVSVSVTGGSISIFISNEVKESNTSVPKH
ncbi:thiamine diphosphokinase [Porphyromonas pogonae]|uniref:thiamine diphosphokinase n=1 Tax=Porphyromonas pogonae TaxID=867595 RepID=UPI002E772FEE|nr:thiamine diphosphokinase [Porphyromonas pogonae]